MVHLEMVKNEQHKGRGVFFLWLDQTNEEVLKDEYFENFNVIPHKRALNYESVNDKIEVMIYKPNQKPIIFLVKGKYKRDLIDEGLKQYIYNGN